MYSLRLLLPLTALSALLLAGCSADTAPETTATVTPPGVVELPPAPASVRTQKTSRHVVLGAGKYVYALLPATYQPRLQNRRYEQDANHYVEARVGLAEEAPMDYYSRASLEARGVAITSWQQIQLNGRPVVLMSARYQGAEQPAANPVPREIMGLVFVADKESSIVQLDGVYPAGDTAAAAATRRILLSTWIDTVALAVGSEREAQFRKEQMAADPTGPPPPPTR